MTNAAATVAAPTVTNRRPSTWERVTSFVPSWGLVATKNLELRRRKGLMSAVLVLILGLPVLILGLRLLFHAIDPSKYSPAGSPSVFSGIVNAMAEFGFIAAAALGAAAGTTDLTDGVFRHLVVTGRSRVALFLARIPAGLAILLPVLAVAFLMLCLVTSFAGIPNSSSIVLNGVSVPAHLSQSQLQAWLVSHPSAARALLGAGPSIVVHGPHIHAGGVYSNYLSLEAAQINPAINEMVKIGLWLVLVVVVGFTAGLGLGSLTGQRTVTTILLIALEIIVTPILAAHVIPYFIDGQRLVVGVALDQLRPAGLASGATGGGPGPGHAIFGGRGALGIPPMPTWGMVSVIVGWIVGWSAIGAWKMAVRDA